MNIERYDDFLNESMKLIKREDMGEYYRIETSNPETPKLSGLLPGKMSSKSIYKRAKDGEEWFDARTGKQLKDKAKIKWLERWVDGIEKKKSEKS